MKTRRTCWIPVVLVLGVIISPRARAQPTGVVIAEGISGHAVVFDSSSPGGAACYRIPSIVTAPNGDLIAVSDERIPTCADLGKNRDINIVARRSSDNGATWSPISSITDHPDGESASDASMIVDRITGEILLFYNYMNHDDAPGVYSLYQSKSADNGVTWSAARDITTQISMPEWQQDVKFITSGRGIQTRSGLLLHTLVNLEHGLHLFASRDHGATWYLIETPIEPGDESKVVELDDGTWMINSRLNGAGERGVHLSGDQGRSWSSYQDAQLPDPGCNASILRYSALADGDDRNRLFFTNANSRESRENITIRVSYDEGLTWNDGKTIYSGSAAYSSSTVLQNQDIGVLFESDSYSRIVFARMPVSWVTGPDDHIANGYTFNDMSLFRTGLFSALYPLEEVTGGLAPLVDGEFSEAPIPGSASKTTVSLGSLIAFGDYSADGFVDAAVTLDVHTGGTGTFTYLGLVLNDSGEAQPVATRFLGDRVRIHALRVAKERIYVTLLTRHPGDAMANEPTVPIEKVYSLRGSELVEVE